MNKPKVLPKRKKEVNAIPEFNITNAAKLPNSIKEMLIPARGVLQQMIAQYVDDTLLYIRGNLGDSKDIIERGEKLQKMLKGLSKSVSKEQDAVVQYPTKINR